MDLVFRANEYTSCPVGIRIPLDTVLKKLPKTQQKAASALLIEQEAERMNARLHEQGITYLEMFLELNRAQTKGGKRAPTVLLQMVTECDRLRLQYGAPELDAALRKVVEMGVPAKANLSYVKTMLRNGSVQSADTPPIAAAPPDHKTAWSRIKQYLQLRLTRASYYTWIDSLQPEQITDAAFVLRVPDVTCEFQLREHYTTLLENAYQSVFGHPPQAVEIIINT